MTVDKRNGDIVVVRDDAIYYYGVDGRGPCYAYDGPKSLVEIYNDYVALVSPPAATAASTRSNTLRRFGGAQADDIFNTSTFTLLDTNLQFVAHSESLVSQVKTLFMIWGDLFTLTQDGKVCHTDSGGTAGINILSRYIGTMRNLYNSDSRSYIKETYMFMPLI
jgi:hypothetical protein